MSYDMVVLRFENGDAVPMPTSAFDAVFGPHVDRAEPEHHFWHVLASDGGEADLYVSATLETIDSLVISRFSASSVLDLLVDFARQARAVVLPMGCPALLLSEAQRCHLPSEFRDEAVVVRHGREIARVLETC